MDERRFAPSWPPSVTVPASVSVAEKDRFRLGERKDAGDNEDCLSDIAAAIDVIGGNRLSSFSEFGICRGKPLGWWYAARSDADAVADGNGESCPLGRITGKGSMVRGWSGRRRIPRLIDPSSFSVPLSGVLSWLRVSIDSADSSCSSSCDAGITRLRLLIVAFFIVTGLCTPWSL